MLDKIADYAALEKSVKSAQGLTYREAIVRHYKDLGASLGYTVRDNFSVLSSGVNYGKLDLIWVEPAVAFAVEFGSLDDIYRHLWKMLELAPKTAVLVLSSKSACKAEDVVKLMEKSKVAREHSKMFLILDITEKKVLRVP